MIISVSYMQKNIFTSVRRAVTNWLPKAAETDKDNNWWYWVYLNEACRSFYSENDILKFSGQNAYMIASTIAEVFFPIDAIADRVSGLKFDIVNDNGDIVDPPANISRLLKSPNPFCSSFADLMYNSVFNELADGNNYIYTKTPKSIKGVSPDTISSIWVLRPDAVTIKLHTNRPDYFNVTKLSDIIEYYQYTLYDDEKIDPRYIIHERNLSVGSFKDGLKSPSPLCAAANNINNLIAVYSARYKVYANNGNAGILTRDNYNTNNLEGAVSPIKRDDIINDILSRNGLVGDKRLWTISSIPLKFIKTLATINELQPFEETEADALQIAGIYGVDKDLIPLKEGTTFSNKAQAEKNLYQNQVNSVAQAKADTFTKAFALDQIGLSFKPRIDDIQVLQQDKETDLKGDALLIDNVIKIRDASLMQGDDAQDIMDKLINKYKNG